MAQLIAIILTVILELPHPWYPPGENPETEAEYEARMNTVAYAIALETKVPEWQALIITTMRYESGFRLGVHSGAVLGDVGRAACLGQLHRRPLTMEAWMALTGVGLPATRRCVGEMHRRLRSARAMCRKRGHDSPEAAMAMYGTGRRCSAPGTARRAATYRRVLNRLYTLRARQKGNITLPAP